MKGTPSHTLDEMVTPPSLIQADEVDVSVPTQRYSGTNIARMLDDALTKQNKAAFELAMSALWQWAHHMAVSKIRDRDTAQDMVQDAIIDVYRVSQQRQLTGAEMVGLTQAKLAGWRNVPGLVTKYRAAAAERHRREISIFAPLSNGTQPTLEIAASPPNEATVLPSQRAHLAQVDALIKQWRHQLSHIANNAERETLQAILTYVETCRADFDPMTDEKFRVIVGSFKRRWHVSPDVLDWLKAALTLKREAAIRDRLLRVRDLLHQYGLNRSSIRKMDLADAITSLQDEAKYLWREPTDRKTLQVVCHWFQLIIDNTPDDEIALQPLLIRKDSQFMLDKRLSAYLQLTLGLRQNTVRKRIDRVLNTLTAWGVLEDIKDE